LREKNAFNLKRWAFLEQSFLKKIKFCIFYKEHFSITDLG